MWEIVWRFLKILKIEIPYDPVIPLLGIYPKNMKTLIQKDISTPMFIAVSFIIAKLWKRPKWPLIAEKIKKIWCVYVCVCVYIYIIYIYIYIIYI